MTTEELILGHFDRALTPEEEKLLQEQLSASPEARTMYDQHRNLDGYLNNDALALGPSARLDEMTLAAALGAVPEVISSGAGAWFGGKMIATIAAVIVGGASIAYLATSGSHENAAPTPAPVVRTLPATPAPATAPQAAPAAEPAAPATVTSEAPAVAHHSTAKSASVAASTKARESAKAKLHAPTGSTTVPHDTKVQREK